MRVASTVFLVCASAVGSVTNVAGADQASAKSDTIVRMAQSPVHPGIAELVPEVSIGLVDGAPEYILSGVSDALELTNGNVLILELPGGTGSLLRQYDQNGKYVRTFGGPGKGPGEYTAPTGLAQLPDGRILLGDTQNGRMNVYAEDGTPLDTWRLIGYPPIVGGREWLTVDTAGTAYLKFVLPRDLSTFPPPTTEVGILRLRPSGAIIDTVFPPKLPDLGPPRFWVVTTYASGGRGYSSPRIPYRPWAWWTISPLGYFVTGLGNRYAIDLRLPPATRRPGQTIAPLWQDGDPVLSIRRSIPPVSVSRQERRDQQQFLDDWIRQAGGRLEGSVPDISNEKPYFKYLFIGGKGRLWVETSTPSVRFEPPPRRSLRGDLIPQATWREPTLYDVFEPDGRYVGQVSVPFGARIKRTTGDVVWAVVKDELDVESVKRLRIDWR